MPPRIPTTSARRRAPLTTALAVAATALTLPAAPNAAADTGQCTFPAKPYQGRPWALQRVLLDELWDESTGKGVEVAVIDTGVDVKHPQLTRAVDPSKGLNSLPAEPEDDNGDPVPRGKADGTGDTVGHGTRVAGLIAARPAKGTGFVGLAPDARIIPIHQNDAHGNGTAASLATSIRHAIDAGADVINISQDTANAVESSPDLKQQINAALDAEIVVVASAGNDGLGGNVKNTYPASEPGVLAVAASDRNNERAPFSQSGEFVGVAAPGVDMVSTVPGGGHCADNGTSFAAPYVAAVAALLRAKHPDWPARRIVAQIQQTAERSVAGHDRLVGWGVVDPVRALTEDDRPVDAPVADEGVNRAEAPTAPRVDLGESAADRDARLATYVTVAATVLAAVLAGVAVTVRDRSRRRDGHSRA
ncbi:type VII secretion-associated serine protease mycosin [Streptomyces sp. NPDC005955]|uniref:type VII secretion-associated serine protease mycosin n=1 Tax=Streptomyces sp. NPDC005955 TaxID=3364738 RepID=UPI00368F9E8F